MTGTAARAGRTAPGPAQVLVINAGSSSMKYQLVDPGTGQASASGLVERIGEADGFARHQYSGETITREGAVADHAAAMHIMEGLFAESGSPLRGDALTAVGHRVVHGGQRYRRPVLVDDDVVRTVGELAVLAPLHNPANAAGIEQALLAFPGVPQVAVFDTAFFCTLPDDVATYAIDRAIAARYQIRRYGFHGISHEYVCQQVPSLLGRSPSELNQIVLHLGNGASASAVRGGVAVETSMGMTPLEGLVMGSRSGDIDPGALLHLQRVGGLGVSDLEDLLNRRSGMIGLAGANDLRDVRAAAEAGDADAELALAIYCHRLRKYIGAYHAVLGGADAITFTAGVGENASFIRARALAGLEKLGIVLDPERNAEHSARARIISADDSPVAVLVVPTNEELAIARAAAEMVRG